MFKLARVCSAAVLLSSLTSYANQSEVECNNFQLAPSIISKTQKKFEIGKNTGVVVTSSSEDPDQKVSVVVNGKECASIANVTFYGISAVSNLVSATDNKVMIIEKGLSASAGGVHIIDISKGHCGKYTKQSGIFAINLADSQIVQKTVIPDGYDGLDAPKITTLNYAFTSKCDLKLVSGTVLNK